MLENPSDQDSEPLFIGGYSTARKVGTMIAGGILALFGAFLIYLDISVPPSNLQLFGLGAICLVFGVALTYRLLFRSPRLEFYENGFYASHAGRDSGRFSYGEIESVLYVPPNLSTSVPRRGGGSVPPRMALIMYHRLDSDYKIFNDPYNRQLKLRLSEWLTQRLGTDRVRQV